MGSKTSIKSGITVFPPPSPADHFSPSGKFLHHLVGNICINALGNRTFTAAPTLMRFTIPEDHFEQAIDIHQLQPYGRRMERSRSHPPRHSAKTKAFRCVG